ncbi:type VI secretion system-associated FHA domain protein TagH [Pseudomonas viridiflava]|uniref:type VI secretion system-associated FHA domain protein TagH n=1 Tax=Pseudomonas viridiflava TaxID=33069 RepID=UPI0010BFA580|nr:type VI secretion system-associated FHA domain protein TagH [Pseudomonas viridiflava]TKJ57059.1 type VI secretion system-associated FHA domain protein TagH [Pseudomonas viridiflava]TKK24527.1 type VI secretion system-associated FHA domain protein TagH [Pseudomonas viridiflava]
MSLCLTITSYHKITPGQCPEKSMDMGVMAIGRGQENDWVLPDPERLVSQKHCVIQYKDGRYYLTDYSTNGVELVNAGVRLRRGNSEPLADGEIIRIGEYEIQVRIDSAVQMVDIGAAGVDSSNSFEALMGRQSAPAPTPSPSSAFSSPPVTAQFQGGSAQDTFPDLFDFLSPSSIAPPTQPDHVPAEQHDFRAPAPLAKPVPVVSPAPAPAPAPAAGLIPDDWDPFADIAKPSVPPAAPRPQEAFVPAPVTPVVIEPVSVAPEPVQTPPPVTPPAIEPHQVQASVSGQPDLLQAFLRGAGLDQLRIDNAQAEAQMHDIGRSYRLMVEGLIDVLRARSSLKSEFRMQQTVIGPVENNPLKFAPNADEAMLLLLRHGNRAFMGPEQAVTDSFDDLRAHQLAVMAGVQAAIKHLLKRFEPAELEARMGAPSNGLSSLFSGSRHAQYWQQFTALYSNITREAEDDFQDLFGREFSRAYEEHSARIRRS